jgi:hypothetical protein
LFGWATAGALVPSPDDDPTLDAAAAVIVHVFLRGGDATSAEADLTVQVSDLGQGPIRLVGARASFDAGRIISVPDADGPIEPGRPISSIVHVSVACRSPQPLRLPPLTVRTSSGNARDVPLQGDSAALTQVCSLVSQDLGPVAVTAVDTVGTRLQVSVQSPTGRTTRIVAIRALGVTLLNSGPSDALDGASKAIWLERPETCPPQWRDTGFPLVLDLDVDNGGPSRMSAFLGYPLARWLRSACPAGS